MEAYYKAQKIIKEEDWDAFLKAARANLPTTFRISPVVAFADDMKKKLRSHFSDLKIDELAQEMAEDDERPPTRLEVVVAERIDRDRGHRRAGRGLAGKVGRSPGRVESHPRGRACAARAAVADAAHRAHTIR